MQRRADGVVSRLARVATRCMQAGRLAIGIPDYDTYVEHMRRKHPTQAPMDRATFFRDRMAARYGRGRSRCC